MVAVNRRIRVLVMAEAANPEWASVPLVGWSHARALADIVDVHLVTQVRNREGIRRAGWIEGEQFTAVDSEAVAARLWRLGNFLTGGGGRGWSVGTALGAMSNYYFEALVWQKFNARIQSGEYDLVHRITPLSPTIPSPIAGKVRRAGIPFVLGPLNGGVAWPRQFNAIRRAEFEWLSYVRGVHKLLPGYHATRQHASAILIASRDTWRQMPQCYHHKCFYLPENAVDPAWFAIRRNRRAARPIRAAFLGRLVPGKGPDMLLEAAAPLLNGGALTLDIIGDGPLGQSLQAFVRDHNLASAVRFRGWVPHEQVQYGLAHTDVLTLPSIKEFGGGVVLEAMALGVVPVVVDYGGPGELVTDETGFAVQLGTRQQIIDRFRRILADLAANPEKIVRKSEMARQRVLRLFTWPAKASQVLRIYRWLLGQAPRPDALLVPTNRALDRGPEPDACAHATDRCVHTGEARDLSAGPSIPGQRPLGLH